MDENKGLILWYKGNSDSSVLPPLSVKGSSNSHTVSEAKKINPLSQTYTSTVATAADLQTSVVDLQSSQRALENGLRYHSNPLFAKTFDLYAACRGVVGKSVQAPSLSQLIDTEEQTLGAYVTCLDQMTGFVVTQRDSMRAEIDQIEKTFEGVAIDKSDSHKSQLRTQVEHAPNHEAYRKALDSLYTQTRIDAQLSSAQEFFEQYIAQEAILNDVSHSLNLIHDQTELLKTYLSKSKGLFITMDSVGQVVYSLSPLVNKMKEHTASLFSRTQSITSFLQEQSEAKLFSFTPQKRVGFEREV